MGDFFDNKLAMLQDVKSSLRTKELVDKLPALLDEYQQRLMDQVQNRQINAEYTASLTGDCKAVKEFMAGLNPPTEVQSLPVEGEPPKVRKTTAAEKEAWFSRQRIENKMLYALTQKQAVASTIIESDKIAVEIAVQRLQNARTVLALKTAQLNFLAGQE